MFLRVLLAILAIALIVLAVIASTQETTPLSLQASKIPQIISPPKTIFAQNPIITKIQTYPNPTQKSTTSKTPSSTLLNTTVDIYDNLSIEEASLQYKPRSYVKPITAISLNHHPLSLGDTMVFPNIEGIDYAIVISHIKQNSDGSKSITGSYKDEGIPYTSTMTQSQNDSFISLSTTKGAYEIETRKGIGYIYKTHEIRKVMQPSPINDVIILPSNPTSQAIE